MAKRTTPSLAFAEYVSPDPDNSFQVWQARLRVIEAAKRVYPIFLKKLSADVFPLYCQLAKEGKLAKGRNDFGKALWGKSPYDALTDEGGLKSALKKWGADFNAEADWLMVGALRTLQGWYVAPTGGSLRGTPNTDVENVRPSAKLSSSPIRDGRSSFLRGKPTASRYGKASKRSSR